MSDAKILEQLSEISSALADIAEALEAERGDPEVAAALVDIVDAISGQKAPEIDMGPLVAAIGEGNRKVAAGMAEVAKTVVAEFKAAGQKPAREFKLSFVPEYDGIGQIRRVTVTCAPTEN